LCSESRKSTKNAKSRQAFWLVCGRRTHRQKEENLNEKTLYCDRCAGCGGGIRRLIDEPGELSSSSVMPTGMRTPDTEPYPEYVLSAGADSPYNTPCCYTWRHGVELFFFIERVLWIASLLAEALVVVRLLHDGLIRKYPFFAAFLTAEVICSLVAMQSGIKTRGYAEVFRICTLILSVFRLGVAAELYQRICY